MCKYFQNSCQHCKPCAMQPPRMKNTYNLLRIKWAIIRSNPFDRSWNMTLWRWAILKVVLDLWKNLFLPYEGSATLIRWNWKCRISVCISWIWSNDGSLDSYRDCPITECVSIDLVKNGIRMYFPTKLFVGFNHCACATHNYQFFAREEHLCPILVIGLKCTFSKTLI